MPKVEFTKSADVPDGELCANWGYRTWMPEEQNFSCSMLRNESVRISASESQSSGLGYSGGTIHNYRCALFDESLSFEFGIGPAKCARCKASAAPGGDGNGLTESDLIGGES